MRGQRETNFARLAPAACRCFRCLSLASSSCSCKPRRCFGNKLEKYSNAVRRRQPSLMHLPQTKFSEIKCGKLSDESVWYWHVLSKSSFTLKQCAEDSTSLFSFSRIIVVDIFRPHLNVIETFTPTDNPSALSPFTPQHSLHLLKEATRERKINENHVVM